MIRPIAVQLYSLRTEAEKDFIGVLKRVAAIGYKGVEPAGFWGLKPKEFTKIIADLGLKMYSSHTPWLKPDNVQQSIDMAGELGLTQVVCGYGPEDFADLDAIKRTAEEVSAMQAKLAAAGLVLFQHNHNWEFERIDGRLKYEIYAELCPNVKFQMDAFWSTNFGAEDPVEMMKKFSKRIVGLHLKDGNPKQKAQEASIAGLEFYDRKLELLPLGSGKLPIPEIIAATPEQVGSVVVELDYCEIEMFKAIEMSYKYLTENGLATGNK